MNIGPLDLEGKYHGPWSKGLQHPKNKQIRFKRKAFIGEGFKSTWIPCWREDHDEIPTRTWLSRMIEDEVLEDVCQKIDLPVPDEQNRERIVELAKRKLTRIYNTKELPEQNLSCCDWPTVCWHRSHCHSQQEPNGRFGFVRISEVQ